MFNSLRKVSASTVKKSERDKLIENTTKAIKRILDDDNSSKSSSSDDKVEPDEQIGISLSGCGFLGTYHFGVMICFQKHAKQLLSRVTHIGGSSAGSLLAALLVLAPDSFEAGLEQFYKLSDELNSYPLGALTPGFHLAERLSLIVDKFIPEDVSIANGKLFISLTKQSDFTNRLVSFYPNRKYLMKCLNASCYIPVYSMGYFATPPVIDGESYIDGGYSNNLPVFENIPTITISPFSGSAIIAPSDPTIFDWRMSVGNQHMTVNLQNVVRGAQSLFPPSSALVRAYYEMGFRDAMKFLNENELLERDEGTSV